MILESRISSIICTPISSSLTSNCRISRLSFIKSLKENTILAFNLAQIPKSNLHTKSSKIQTFLFRQFSKPLPLFRISPISIHMTYLIKAWPLLSYFCNCKPWKYIFFIIYSSINYYFYDNSSQIYPNPLISVKNSNTSLLDENKRSCLNIQEIYHAKLKFFSHTKYLWEGNVFKVKIWTVYVFRLSTSYVFFFIQEFILIYLIDKINVYFYLKKNKSSFTIRLRFTEFIAD